ncbi:TIR domain-containing protein [Streptomyces sp. 4.24]|uniref:TIR domain-containing protein n=1 Tax=Streptomyces tritrimontium TaxID=3406573 RepID=UPI003BB71B34
MKEASPATLISFDPGHVWCTLPTEEVLGICGLTAYLMLNRREFHELGRRNGGDTDEGIAGHLLQGLANDRSVILVKRRTGIHVWRSENGKAVEDFHPQIVLADDQIEDATGAGDVFAAGLLAEDATGDGQLVARQNVIHEIGLFQGHYGFDRVIVLAEDGCESVPLPAEPYTSTFPRHAIDRTFWSVDRALQNQGFSHI